MADKEVVHVVGQRYSLEILQATDEPTTASQLSEVLEIPIATAYRRVEDLTGAGLLTETGRVQETDGRSAAAFRRSVDGVHVLFGNETAVRLDSRSTVTESLDSAWDNLTGRV